jgi:hypothetical protein
MRSVLVGGGDEMYLQSPRRMCAPIHKRPPFRSRMRPARVSARPRIFGVKINECTTIYANLVREDSSEKRIAPLKWNVGMSISHARVRPITYGFTIKMSLSSEHNNVGIQVIIIILEASNRRTLGDLSIRINNRLGIIHAKT